MALHVINLTYKEVPAKMRAGSTSSSTQGAGEQYEAIAKRIDQKVRHEKDTLAWTTDDDDYVTVELRPRCMFSKHLFSTDPDFCKDHNINVGEPIEIKEKAPFQYWCGFRDKKTGEIVGYPTTKDIGVEDPGHP